MIYECNNETCGVAPCILVVDNANDSLPPPGEMFERPGCKAVWREVPEIHCETLRAQVMDAIRHVSMLLHSAFK